MTGTRGADGGAPARVRFKVDPHTAEVMSGRSSDARKPWIRQCLLGSETRRGVGIEGTDKVLGFDPGYQGLAVR